MKRCSCAGKHIIPFLFICLFIPGERFANLVVASFEMRTYTQIYVDEWPKRLASLFYVHASQQNRLACVYPAVLWRFRTQSSLHCPIAPTSTALSRSHPPIANVVTFYSRLKNEKYSRSSIGATSVVLGSKRGKYTLKGWCKLRWCELNWVQNLLLPSWYPAIFQYSKKTSRLALTSIGCKLCINYNFGANFIFVDESKHV